MKKLRRFWYDLDNGDISLDFEGDDNRYDIYINTQGTARCVIRDDLATTIEDKTIAVDKQLVRDIESNRTYKWNHQIDIVRLIELVRLIVGEDVVF